MLAPQTILLDHLGKRWPLRLTSAPPLEDVFVAARHIRILEVLLELVAHHPPRLAQPPPSLLLLDASAEEAAEEDLPLSLTLRRLEERKWASPSEKEWASPSREGHGEGLPRSPQVGATPE